MDRNRIGIDIFPFLFAMNLDDLWVMREFGSIARRIGGGGGDGGGREGRKSIKLVRYYGSNRMGSYIIIIVHLLLFFRRWDREFYSVKAIE